MDANFLFEYFCNPINQAAALKKLRLKRRRRRMRNGGSEMKITGAANLTFAFSWHLNKVLNFPLSALLSAYYFGAG